MAIIRLLGHKSKTKDTFLSSTLKVWESKVSLFFWYMAQGLRYWHFSPWRWHVLLLLRFKRRNGHISAPGPQIKKLRTLSFLQLLKFEKAKYPYFFNLWPRGRDIGLFSLDDGTYSSSSFWKVTLQRKHFPVEFRAGSDVFEIIEACRMGAACKQIENQTFIFFAPPLISIICKN